MMDVVTHQYQDNGNAAQSIEFRDSLRCSWSDRWNWMFLRMAAAIRQNSICGPGWRDCRFAVCVQKAAERNAS